MSSSASVHLLCGPSDSVATTQNQPQEAKIRWAENYFRLQHLPQWFPSRVSTLMPQKVAAPERIVMGTVIADPTGSWSCRALSWLQRRRGWSAGPAFVGTPAGTAAGPTEHVIDDATGGSPRRESAGVVFCR